MGRETAPGLEQSSSSILSADIGDTTLHALQAVIRDADAWINNEGEGSPEYRLTLCVPSVIDLRGKFPPDDKY